MWKWMAGPSVRQVVSRSIGWTARSSTCSAHASEWVESSMRQTSVPDKARRSLSPGRSRLKSPAPRTCSVAAFATSLRRTLRVSPEPERWYEIVGVVEDFPADYDQATVYHPLLPGPVRQVTVTLRVGPDAGLAATRLREVTRAIDPALRIARLQSLGEIYRQRGSVGSTLSFMLGSVMLIVVLFAMAGMYTLMAFIVAQRWREVGVRCALGASPGRLVREIFGRSLVPLVIGASVGCLLALADRFLDSGGGCRRPEHPRHCSGYGHGHDSRRGSRSRRSSPSRHSHQPGGSPSLKLERTDGS